MSIRKIRKAGQKKAFRAATYKGNVTHAYRMCYSVKNFQRILPKKEFGLDKLLDNLRRKKKLAGGI